MHTLTRLILGFALLWMAGAIGPGCAAIQRSETQHTERLLAAAGFQMRLAESPEKLAKLKALPQHELIPRRHLERVFFVYADATDCKCLWVGTQRAQRHYRRLEMRQEIANEELMAADSRQAAAMDIGAFGPWGPWW